MTKPQKNKRLTTIKTISIFAIFLLLLLVLISFILYNQTSPRIFGKTIVYSIDNLAASISFLPKTSRQVLVRAALVQKNLSSYKVDFSLKVSTEAFDIVDIESQGFVANAGNKNSQIASNTKGQIFLPEKVEFDFDTYSTAEKILFKVNNEIDIYGVNTKNFKGWYEMDVESLKRDLKVDIKSESEIIKDVNSQLETILDGQFKNSGIKLGETSKDGKTYFEVKTVLSDNPISKTFVSPTDNRDTDLVLLINKDTFQLDHLSLNSVENAETKFVFQYSLSEHNKRTVLTKPEQTQKINNPVELYLLLKGEDKPDTNDLLSALGGEVKEVTTTLLTIERLTKVLLLLPKSF